jgi:Tfp pilus assembly protein PilV
MCTYWNRNNKLHSAQGTLLLEVLLAVVILSTSLSVIVKSLASSLRAMATSADYSKAMILLENKMFELMRKKIIDASFTDAGGFPSPFEKYQYTVKTHGTAEGNQPNGVNEVEVRVFWSSGLNQKGISATTCLLDPLTGAQQDEGVKP